MNSNSLVGKTVYHQGKNCKVIQEDGNDIELRVYGSQATYWASKDSVSYQTNEGGIPKRFTIND